MEMFPLRDEYSPPRSFVLEKFLWHDRLDRQFKHRDSRIEAGQQIVERNLKMAVGVQGPVRLIWLRPLCLVMQVSVSPWSSAYGLELGP